MLEQRKKKTLEEMYREAWGTPQKDDNEMWSDIFHEEWEDDDADCICD